MNTRNVIKWTASTAALAALVCGFAPGRAVAAPYAPPAALAAPDYFAVANYANSPLPGGTSLTFTVTSGGSGYTAAPGVTISDPGCTATATATVTGGAVTAVTPGTVTGSCIAPQVTVAAPPGVTAATATAAITGGAVSSITVSAGGSGYTTAPAVSITGGGGTTPATATATVTGGVVTAITVNTGGSGYTTTPTVTIGAPAAGTTASVTAAIGGTITGMQKFLDALPGLCPASAKNGLGQCIPVAVPDTTTFTGSDYYSLGLSDYNQQMHSNLPPAGTKLRGYVQLTAGGAPVTVTDMNSAAVVAHQYLGPMIVAEKNRAVRVKFTNNLGIGSAGDLFIPTDTTYMGAGKGPDGASWYTQNRAVIHLHGGHTPWISDGTPHQWITPVGENTATYLKGDSFQNVPDMVGPSSPIGMTNPTPGDGLATYYWTNQQSGRLLFYHDHAYGTTRTDVYAGEVAPYLIVDPVEDAALKNAGVPGTIPNVTANGNADLATADLAHLVPLVIQDKTFVPAPAQLTAQDPTWNTTLYGGQGNLWFPHVYMPNQDNNNLAGANNMGRWDYGPWFWPPQASLTAGPITTSCSSAAYPGKTVQCPITPNPSGVPEGFMDTMVVNGTAYPYLTVAPQAYRFHILNGSNDRMLNLSLFYAANAAGTTVCKGAGTASACTEVKMLPALPPTAPLPLCGAATTTNIAGLAIAAVSGGLPINGTGLPQNCWPTTWPTDGRVGGVPDPTTAGPPIIQIGTDSGLLPSPVVIPATPVGYDYNRRSITVLNVLDHALMLGPAERADVIIDFSSVPTGSTLILYNDSPAPVPGFDPRNDYYTGNPDQTSSGGAPSTQAGYGPNTRTVMQFRVTGTAGTPVNLTTLQSAVATAYQAAQPTPIVPESGFNATYGTAYTDTYVPIQGTSITYTPVGSATAATAPLVSKTIQELFTADYGRMNALLGTELPLTNFLTQTTIQLAYIDPPTEIVRNNQTQLWKITHNGVDTHAIHFHLFDVQLINRVGWDGMIKPPDDNEIGWKDTVRMNPLEDVIVALRPIRPSTPFGLPNSVRLLDTTQPLNSTMGFTGRDPYTGQPMPVSNVMYNFGHEYVWHCHLLGHEENDMMRPIVLAMPPQGDFTGYGKTDIAVWRPGTGEWWINSPTNGNPTVVALGINGDKLVPGDYDGDNKTDMAVWRPSTGTWYINNTYSGTQTVAQYGQNGDIPVPGDYDGIGKTEIAIWRPSDGNWYINNTTSGTQRVVNYGANGDIPVPGNYDGSSTTEIAVFRPSTGTWYIINSAGTQSVVQYGANGDIPVPGDYDGDGKTDIAVWRNGTWFITNSATNTQSVVSFGTTGDIPVPGDYDNIGRAEMAVWRPSTGTWFILNPITSATRIISWGTPTDQPVKAGQPVQ